MNGEIRIEIRGEEDSARDFIDAWHRAERNEPPEEPVHRLYFQSLEALLRILTPRRLELLKTLHGAGPQSVRGLAKLLGRDYKNIYHEVQLLENVGLVQRNSDKRLLAPWEKVVAELKLAA